MSADLNRRDFLSACAVLASCLAACAGSTQRTKIAASFLVDPAIEDYRPALDALIRTVLPIGSDGFPLDLETVESRLLRMFPLEHERRFLGFQRTLAYFDQLDLAPHIAAPLIAAERIALDVPVHVSENEFRTFCAAATEAESRACSEFSGRFPSIARFSALPAEGRNAWLRLWASSSFTVKRDFARTTRILVFCSAYTADAVWPSIGYDGPLVAGGERG